MVNFLSRLNGDKDSTISVFDSACKAIIGGITAVFNSDVEPDFKDRLDNPLCGPTIPCVNAERSETLGLSLKVTDFTAATENMRMVLCNSWQT